MNQYILPQDKYNTSEIRRLLQTAFSDEEFTIFCYDNYPNVFKEFTSGMTSSAKVQLLVDSCRRTNSFSDLLRLVKESNPNQYELFSSSLQETVKKGELQSVQQLEQGLDEKATLSSAVKIFLCYSRKDTKMARRLAKDLQEASFAVWRDVSDLQGGVSWGRTIQAAIEVSKCCLVLLSPDSNQSKWVEKEYLYAMEWELEIIPLLYKGDKRPLALIDKQYIDFRGNNYKERLQNLLVVLREASNDTTIISDTSPPKLKEKLLIISRDPMWQMIGVIIAIIALSFTIYPFYFDTIIPDLATPTAVGVTLTTNTPTLTLTSIPTNTPVLSTTTPLLNSTSTDIPTPTATLVPDAPTPTLTLVPNIPTPTIALITTPTVSSPPTATNIPLPVGQFILLKPVSLDQPSYGLTEFEWRWNGSVGRDQGFEVRVWRENETPQGVHSAVEDNQNGKLIALGNNVYRLIANIYDAPGVQGHTGEYLWTVLLVQIRPEYKDLDIQATPGHLRFEAGGSSGSDNNSVKSTPEVK